MKDVMLRLTTCASRRRGSSPPKSVRMTITTFVSRRSSLWADRASALYDEAYARRYRAHDEEFLQSGPCQEFAAWLRRVCQSLPPPIDVLDLGCGTGRYFWALTGVRELVGIDASAAMLAEARHPYNSARITAASVILVQDDLSVIDSRLAGSISSTRSACSRSTCRLTKRSSPPSPAG
jgi:SAM-dependent methyltransferase